jgi:hypothetical protein
MCCPKRDAGPKKKEKHLWRSLLRTTIWQQPINPHIPFFHKTSLQKKERKKKNLREIQSRQLQFESWRKRNYSQCTISFSGLFVSSVPVLPKLQITIKR